MLQSCQLVERNWMSGLLLLVCAGSMALARITPQPPFLFLLCSYLVALLIALAFSNWHHRRICEMPLKTNSNPSSKTPSVLVIVPARNEEAVIEKTIENLLSLDYENYQLLAVDDRSDDATADLLKKMQAQNSQKLLVHSRDSKAKSGKAAVLNEVSNFVESDLIAIFDADTMVAKDFLTRIVGYFDDENVSAVQARKSLLNAKENILTRCQHYEYLIDAYFQSSRDNIIGAVELRGNGMLIRTSTLNQLSGFNECNLTEDLDLSTRMQVDGYDVRYASDVLVFEECPSTLLPLLQQRTRWMEGSLIRYFEHASKIFGSSQSSFRLKLDCFLCIFQFTAPLWLLTESIGVIGKAWLAQATLSPVFFASSAILALSLYFFYAAVKGIVDFKEGNVLTAFGKAVIVNIYLSALFPLIVIYLAVSLLCRTRRNLKWVKIHHYGVLAK